MPERHHRGMRMKVDQSGYQQMCRQRDALPGGETLRRLVNRQEPHDAAVTYHHCVVFEHGGARHDRRNPACLDQQIDSFHSHSAVKRFGGGSDHIAAHFADRHGGPPAWQRSYRCAHCRSSKSE